jgi:hypothetical protein
MLCDSVYLLLYPYKKIRVWAFCVFLVDFYNYVIFPIIFSNCATLSFFLAMWQKKNTIGLKGKHDQPAGWFETIKSVLLLPQVAFYTRTWIVSQLTPAMISFFCQSLFLFFSFLFSFLVLLVCFCILFPCFRVLIFWIIFLIICYLVSCPNFLDNML